VEDMASTVQPNGRSRRPASPGPGGGSRPDPDRGVYGISVAAELTGVSAQTLRSYETRGLLEPDRTAGGTRRYSVNDLDRIRRIGDLLDAGLNLAGVGMVLDLERQNSRLRDLYAQYERSAPKEEQQWLAPASTPLQRSRKRTSSTSTSPSRRSR